MDITTLWQSILLGIVEGATEFIPVSSTGHLIFFSDLLGFKGPEGFVFQVVIQLGAILAVCWLYRHKLLTVAMEVPTSPKARHFAYAVFLAFFPAMVVGAFAHDIIKETLFNPWVVAIALIVGGVVILLIEAYKPAPQHNNVDTLPLRTALGIGFCQVLAMIPGVSRSGATVMGALLCGVERRTAAEFSFFLAIPTMFGATAYDIYKNYDQLTMDDAVVICVGFVSAFVAALFVVRTVIAFISKYGFGPFAWYRVVMGCVMIGLLYADIA